VEDSPTLTRDVFKYLGDPDRNHWTALVDRKPMGRCQGCVAAPGCKISLAVVKDVRVCVRVCVRAHNYLIDLLVSNTRQNHDGTAVWFVMLLIPTVVQTGGGVLRP